MSINNDDEFKGWPGTTPVKGYYTLIETAKIIIGNTSHTKEMSETRLILIDKLSKLLEPNKNSEFYYVKNNELLIQFLKSKKVKVQDIKEIIREVNKMHKKLYKG